MRSFYMRIFKNIICIYVLALCCFAYATMIHAIPDHVYVQEGQKLELDKKIPVTLAMSTKPQSVMAQIGERTYQAMKQERAVETCSQLKQGEYTLTCYLFGILLNPAASEYYEATKKQALLALADIPRRDADRRRNPCR